jgi:hypothetical protein
MNIRNWLILGLALVLAFTLTVGLPRVSQAQQQKDPAVAYGPGGQVIRVPVPGTAVMPAATGAAGAIAGKREGT